MGGARDRESVDVGPAGLERQDRARLHVRVATFPRRSELCASCRTSSSRTALRKRASAPGRPRARGRRPHPVGARHVAAPLRRLLRLNEQAAPADDPSGATPHSTRTSLARPGLQGKGSPDERAALQAPCVSFRHGPSHPPGCRFRTCSGWSTSLLMAGLADFDAVLAAAQGGDEQAVAVLYRDIDLTPRRLPPCDVSCVRRRRHRRRGVARGRGRPGVLHRRSRMRSARRIFSIVERRLADYRRTAARSATIPVPTEELERRLNGQRPRGARAREPFRRRRDPASSPRPLSPDQAEVVLLR